MTPIRSITLSPVHLALILGAIALLLVGFLGGEAFERIHTRHFLGWQNHYQQNFFDAGRQQRPQTHGLIGKILSVDNNTLTVQSREGNEQSITLTDSTAIRRAAGTASRGDLQPNMQIAVFGHPNGKGQIEADLIRIF
jgi:hypothetical protein